MHLQYLYVMICHYQLKLLIHHTLNINHTVLFVQKYLYFYIFLHNPCNNRVHEYNYFIFRKKEIVLTTLIKDTLIPTKSQQIACDALKNQLNGKNKEKT